MAVARVNPETIDAAALGFRLAPRINAAGRLYRADAGVELMLTTDADRAAQIADELDRANGERRWAEREVVEGAERARSALPASLADAPALVLAGRGKSSLHLADALLKSCAFSQARGARRAEARAKPEIGERA